MKKYFLTEHQLIRFYLLVKYLPGGSLPSEILATLRKIEDEQEIVKDPDVMSVHWSIQDVQAERPDLSDDQAREVLTYLIDNHDANNGVNWEAINYAAYVLFGAAPEAAEKKEEEHV